MRRRRRWLGRAPVALALLLVAALSMTFFLSSAASANATIGVTPNADLTNGQGVTVTGSGLAANSTGSVLECNNASPQPTVNLPAPISETVPVSCSGISGATLATTTSTGTLSASFTIISPTPGPPCGAGDLVSCPSTDSAVNSPASDAALFPCPPTPAQLSAGFSCGLVFGDQGGDQITAGITLSSGGGGTTTTTTTSASTTTTSTTTTTTTTNTEGTTVTAPTGLPGFLTVVAGQSTMIQGPGFKPGEAVTVTIHSTTIQLGTFTANGSGVATGTIMIPVGTVVGYHEIYLTGETSGHVVVIPAWIIGGQPTTLASSTSSPATSSGSTTGGTTTGGTPSASGGSLAYTGAGRGVWLTLVGGLLLLDLGYLLITMFLRPRELLARRANRQLDSTPQQ